MAMRDRYLHLGAWGLAIERKQASEEGRKITHLEDRFETLIKRSRRGEAVEVEAGRLLEEVQAIEAGEQGWAEPTRLNAIHQLRPNGPRTVNTPRSPQSHVLGAWQGRCAGCLLGKPIETLPAEAVWDRLHQADAFPLETYLSQAQLGDELTEAIPSHNRTFADTVSCMPRDDDLDYTVLGLSRLQKHGLSISSTEIAAGWLDQLPIRRTYTAERVAYRNLVNGLDVPTTAAHRNPFREWIGALIRADIYGYTHLGRPERAATLAWRDARISHVGNGVYGAMWVAAMLAAAPVASDIRRMIEIGLSEIPAESRLASCVESVMDWHEEGVAWTEAVDQLHDRWDDETHHDWLHVLCNAQAITLGLLWSNENFGTGVTRTVHTGFDADCTGATVGSILGMRVGADGISPRWIEPLQNTIQTAIAARPQANITDVAEETTEIAA